jgi:glucose-1-phosphate thymidylyltransferase
MKSILLAAGYSTRLRPLTDHTPKPLLTVGSGTILDSILAKVLKIPSLDQILVVVNARFHAQFETWRLGLPAGLTGGRQIELLNDGTTSNETRLGAVGDICLGLNHLGMDEDVLIIAGDNLFEADLQAMAALRVQHDASVLGVHQYPSLQDVRRKFGVALAGPDGRLLEFVEKPETPKSSLAATAVYLLRPPALPYVTALYRAPHSGELNAGNLIQELLRKGEKVCCFDIPAWFDIGTHEDLARARQTFGSGPAIS